MTTRRTLCNVRGCNNNFKNNKNLSFFTLPKDEERRDTWLKLIGRTDLQQKRYLRPASHSVCSDHFDPSMVILIPKLKPEAIPTINLPGTRNVANSSKYGSSDSSEPATSDSKSLTPAKVTNSNNSKKNNTNPTKMVEEVVEIEPEKDNLETVLIKKEKNDLETVLIKKEKDDIETEHIEEVKDDSAPTVTAHVKVEKDASDTEPGKGGNNDLVEVHIKEEIHDLEIETPNSLSLKAAAKDTPSTSTFKPVESELESVPMETDTSTQTKFSKIKKSKKKKATTETTPDKITIQSIIESEYKRRKV